MDLAQISLFVGILTPLVIGAATFGVLSGRLAGMAERLGQAEGRLQSLDDRTRDYVTKEDLRTLKADLLAAMERHPK